MNQHSEPSTRQSLIVNARDGDREAWEDVCHIYVPVVLQWAHRGIRHGALSIPPASYHDAEEIAQTVLTKLFERLEQFSFPGEHRDGVASRLQPSDPGVRATAFRPWLHVMTIRTAIDLHRRKSIDGVGGSSWRQVLENHPEILSIDDGNTTWTEIKQALGVMQTKFGTSKGSCDLFLKRAETEIPFEELGAEFGLSAANARSRYRHVRNRLRKLLAGIADTQILESEDEIRD